MEYTIIKKHKGVTLDLITLKSKDNVVKYIDDHLTGSSRCSLTIKIKHDNGNLCNTVQ